MNKTICAISTPLGKGAISIVRMSGPDSLKIMKKVFYSKNLDYEKICSRYLYFGNLTLENGLIERCLAVYFKNPFSYTGEDMVEFQIHGGTYLTKSVLNLLMSEGAVLAENGEFTKRAFENGKISLDMAESIIDEINAESEGELKVSLNKADRKFFNDICSMQNELTSFLAEIEATLDYPEEDFEEQTKSKIFNCINEIQQKIAKYIEDSKYSTLISNGINVAIVGSPNVGKSSTLNSLIGLKRAIVTDIEGTTRDALTESIVYKGIKINFTDTAGIRESSDEVEKIGIDISLEYIKKADVILFILDASKKMSEYDKKVYQILKNYDNVLIVVNKIDLGRKLEKLSENEILVSALNDENISAIKEKIFKMVEGEKINYDHTIITSSRQLESLNKCLNSCAQILQSQLCSMDIVSMLIKKLWNELGTITGQCENEDIIDMIFSKFCLGK